MQRERMTKYFRPAHIAFDARILPAGHAASEVVCAFQAVGQFLRAIRLAFEQLAQLGQFFLRVRKCLGKAIALADRLAGNPGVVLMHHQPQIACGFIQCAGGLLQIFKIAGMFNTCQTCIAREFDQLRGGDDFTKEHRRRFRQLVCFIEDDGIAGWQ